MEFYDTQNETIFYSYSYDKYPNEQYLDISKQTSFEDCFIHIFKNDSKEFENDIGNYYDNGIFREPKENKQIEDFVNYNNNKVIIQNDEDFCFIKKDEEKKKHNYFKTKIEVKENEKIKFYEKQIIEIKEKENKKEEIKKEVQKEFKKFHIENMKKEKNKEIIKIENRQIEKKEGKKIKEKSKISNIIFKKGSTDFHKFFIETEKKEIKTNNTKRKKKAKKEKFKRKRKFKPDDIRKKIKARFHKKLKNIINEKLKIAGSKEFFDFLPQSFLSNISKDKNKEVMKLTYRQILEKDFTIELKENKLNKIKVDKEKYEKNLKVLKYLDENIQISNDSGFTIISNMTYADILKEYFLSQEFEQSILKLINENEKEDYIKEYFIKAKSYVKFFMKHKEIDYKEDSIIVSDEEMHLEK